MHDSIETIDLNLLVVLHALMAERHVTRAAKRVGLSQSAASHALARLRAVTGDPLFVRTRGGMAPTPRADALAEPVSRALATIRGALRAPEAFDPARARRTFRIVAGDLAELVLCPPLLARLGAEAPFVDVRILPPSPDVASAVLQGDVDLAMGLLQRPARAGALREAELFDESFVCVVRRGHPLARGRFTLSRYLGARHAVIAPRGQRGGIVDDLLAERGLERRVVLTIPHFLAAPHVVAASDLVLTLPTRVAQVVAGPLGLVVLRPPLDVPDFTMSMTWHTRTDGEPGHGWLRALLVEIARAVPRARPVARPRR